MFNIHDYTDGDGFKGYFDSSIENIVTNIINNHLNQKNIDFNEQNNEEQSINILNSPDFTLFKKVYKRHTNFMNFSGKDDLNFNFNSIEYSLDLMHIKRPIIILNEDTITESLNRYFIKMVKDLLEVSEDEAIKKIKRFNGDVYKTIILG